nr:MAG TPA: hydrogenase/urease nickel incorporation protein [Caudoviricetes sp.]
MAEGKKIIRLVDVGELEANLREALHRKLLEPDSDELAPHSESIACELEDLGSLPTIHPESLRGHAKWVKDKELKFIIVDDENNSHEEPAICCTHCKAKISQSDFDSWVWNFCPVCGFKMEDATNG